MYNTPEQFAGANKANVETLLTVANTAFASAERLAALNLNTARILLEDSVNNAKALLSVKDVQELLNMQTALAQPAFEKAIAYSRSVYEIATQTQEEFAKIFDTQYVEMNKNVTSAAGQGRQERPGRFRCRRRRRQVGHRRRQLGLRHHEQGCQAGCRDGRSERCCRHHRDRQGCRRCRSEGQESRLSRFKRFRLLLRFRKGTVSAPTARSGLFFAY